MPNHACPCSPDKGCEADNTGTVEFRADWQATAGREKGALHEVSTFAKQGDRWYYVDGEQKPA